MNHMEDDFLVEMGCAGLTGRLKRLSDAFIYSTKEYYRNQNLEIEPNWHMIFMILKKHKKLTVTDISETLNISHSAVVQLADKMKKKGYINTSKDPQDKRKHQLSLSQKAREKLPEFEHYWDAGNEALVDLMNNAAVLKALKTLEDNFEKADFCCRSEEKLKETPS